MQKYTRWIWLVWLGTQPLFGQELSDFELTDEVVDSLVWEGKTYRQHDFLHESFSRIEFVEKSIEIQSKSYPSLDNLAELLTNYRTLRIDIQCYADDQNTDVSSEKLSENRATALKNYLYQVKGISFERITPTGLGRSNPTKKDKIEIKIIEFLPPQKADTGGYYHDYLGGKLYQVGDILDETLTEIEFENTDELTAHSLESLGKLAEWMLLNDAVRVEIGCYADTVSNQTSVAISEQRANRIKAYLLEVKGVASERVEAIGYGQNRQANGKKHNRTEIKLIALYEE